MTTPGAVPEQPPPSTGDEREDQAAVSGAEAAAILAAATAAILAAMAAAIAAVVAGSLSVQMAKRKIRRTIAATLGAASVKLGPVYRSGSERRTKVLTDHTVKTKREASPCPAASR